MLAKFSVEQQQAFYTSSNNVRLSISAKNANEIIKDSINDIINGLNSSKANINFVNTSLNNVVIVKSSIMSPAIYSQVINGTDANSTLVNSIVTKGSFNIKLNKIYINTNEPNKIYYDIKITSTICDNKMIKCTFENLNMTTSRACPTPTQGSMRAMLSNELPTGSTYGIGDLYCTCNQLGLNRTTDQGDCQPSSCPEGQYISGIDCVNCSATNCKKCDNNTCSECNSGFYLNNGTCIACPTSAGVASCNGTSSFTCSSGYYPSSGNCVACTTKTGVATCDPVTGVATSCLAGFGLRIDGLCSSCVAGRYSNGGNSNCISCSSGYYSKVSRSTSCTACSNLGTQVKNCSITGVITECNAGYFGTNCSSQCAGIISGSYPYTCTACPANAICSGGVITGCNAGYELQASTSTCNACASGTYTSTSGINPCASCSNLGANVSSCSTTGSITGCKSGYYGSSCGSQCATGTIASGTYPNITCVSCPTNATCSGGIITGCKSGYYGLNCSMLQNQCLGYISGTTYPNITCSNCPNNAICSGGKITGCFAGFYSPYSNPSYACYFSCSGYITGTGTNLTCNNCPANAICSNGAITGCINGYWGTNCGSYCSQTVIGSYPYTCGSCPANSICSGGMVTGCTSGYYYDAGKVCLDQCSGVIGGASPSQTCTACPVNAVCSNGSIIGCGAGYNLMLNPPLSGYYCLFACGTGTYKALSGSSSCISCSNLGAGVSSCSNFGMITGCNAGYYGSDCGSTCAGIISGSYPYLNCDQCPANGICSGGVISGCGAGFSLSNGSCTCPTGYVTTSGSTSTCNACPANSICSNGVITGCTTGYILDSGRCVYYCPLNSFQYANSFNTGTGVSNLQSNTYIGCTNCSDPRQNFSASFCNYCNQSSKNLNDCVPCAKGEFVCVCQKITSDGFITNIISSSQYTDCIKSCSSQGYSSNWSYGPVC